MKSKCLVFAQFWSKSDNSFFDWCKTVNILVEKYFPHKYDDKYGIFLQKTWRAGLWNPKFYMKTQEASCKKISQNNFFHSAALHCENAIWNLQIFSVIFSSSNIFDMPFWDLCSTRPLILFTSFLQLAWIETGSIVNPSSVLDCVQLVPKYYSKVKVRSWQSPNISVWNNKTARKWVRWWKSQTFHFTFG